MGIIFTTTLRSSRVQKIADAIDAGLGPGELKLYTGAPPAACGAITTQTLLGTLTCSDPCGTVTDGVFTFGAIAQDSAADATGTAGFMRVLDSNGLAVADLTCGSTGSGEPVELNTLSIVATGPISVSGATITDGNA